jgi:outer membrane immunogenic protein
MTSKFITAGLAAAALLVASYDAQAADLRPVYKGAPRSVHAYYNWTGAYAGLYAGYGWGRSTWDLPAVTIAPRGAMFGGTLGYNWQVGTFVYGIEGDVGWSGIKGSAACGLFTCETRNQFFGTVRGRAGLAFDSLLPYITGGAAIGDIKATSTNPLFPGGNGTKVGWTVGGGLEYAFLHNWTAKVEYLYFNLGSIDCGIGCGALTPNRVSLTGNRVTVGLNYKFGGGKY